MTLFNNLTSDGLETTGDSLGGFSAVNSDIYTGKIKSFYAGKSAGGANSLTLELALPGGRSYRETVYMTNKQGQNFFLNKQDNSKKVPLPGFTIINDIALCTLGVPLAELAFEDKVLNIWDSEAGKEMPKSVPVAIDILGQEITVAIHKNLEDKTVKQGDSYVPTGDSKEVNVIDKVFNTATKMTVAEAMAGEKTPQFHDAWLERNKDKVRDKTSKNDNTVGAGAAGRPGVPTAGAPAAAGGGARKSLFGN